METLRLLLVEDNLADAKSVANLLAETRRHRFEVQTARDLETALSHLDAQTPDAVLIDLRLPDGQGLTAFHRLQAAAPGVPFLILTGLEDEPQALEAISAGAQEYLDKARLDSVLLERAIWYAIERKRIDRQLRWWNEELERRVAERTTELCRANQQLDAFSYSVSHDLQAPLELIKGFARALVQDCGEQLDERGRHYVERIQASAARMSQLIAALLRLSRVSSHEMAHEHVDLSGLAHTICREFEQRQPGRRTRFIIEDGLRAYGDPNMLSCLLENLLQNAWKFTDHAAAPQIEFGLAGADDERAFYVRDNGVGFDPADVERMFLPFQRLHDSEAFSGLGIGLATVRRIVERHHGRVWSEGKPDEGAAFFFTLPSPPQSLNPGE